MHVWILSLWIFINVQIFPVGSTQAYHRDPHEFPRSTGMLETGPGK